MTLENKAVGSFDLKKSLQSRRDGCRHGDIKRYKDSDGVKLFIANLRTSQCGVKLPSSKSSETQRQNELSRSKRIDFEKKVALMNAARKKDKK